VHMVNVIGFTLPQWQAIWGTMLAANVAANLLAGYASDRFGRINVIAWGGGVGTAVSVLALYYVPTLIGPNVAVVMVIGIVYGLALGMYVPLSAVVPLLAPRHRASAVAVLNLGAGLSNFGGPLLAGLVGPLGIAAVVWILAGLYLLGVVLTFALRVPGVDTDNAPVEPDRDIPAQN
jgi:MFS family permease